MVFVLIIKATKLGCKLAKPISEPACGVDFKRGTWSWESNFRLIYWRFCVSARPFLGERGLEIEKF